MVKKTYSIWVEESVVEKAEKHLAVGQKLSPVIQDLLEVWIEHRIKEKKLLKNIKTNIKKEEVKEE